MIAILKPEPIEGLTQPERNRLQHLEAVIQIGFKAYLEAGRALNEIRESRLYREDGTFENYLQLRWNLKQSRAYQLMEAATVVEELMKSSTIVELLPTNEAQCRELAKIEPEKRPRVWQETVERTDGKPTARDIRETAGLPSQRYYQGCENTDPAEEWEDAEPQPAQRYAVALFRRPDLTEAERALKDKYEYCIREIATGEVVPTWEDLRSLYEQFGVWLANQEAQEQGVIAFGAQNQLKYVVSRPDLNGGKDFPLRLFSPEHAWRFYQDERDRYLGLMERKPMSNEFTVPVEPETAPRTERIENDYYPTPEAITRPLLHLGCIKGQVFEPCAGSGDIAKLFDGCVSNELYPRPEFEPDLIGDASDPELWAELDRMGGTDWVISNPPYKDDLPAKILNLAAGHSREGVALLLRLSFAEPCQERRELLQRLSDHLRYFIPVNPRPQFRKDVTGTDPVTVAWYVWDFTWSWEDQGIDCPFKFITDWKEAA